MTARTLSRTDYHALRERVRQAMADQQIGCAELARRLDRRPDAVRHAVAPTGVRYPALLRQLAAYLGVEDMP